MIFKEHITWALSSIVWNKLRSWLSMLWIIIWVFAIIVMMALWQGTTQSVVERFNSLWANLITVTAGWSNQSNVRSVGNSTKTNILDEELVAYIKQIPWVTDVSPSVSSSRQFIYQTYNTNTSVLGVLPQYQTLKNLTLSQGSFITQEDVDESAKVIVLWNTLATNAFGSQNPIGQEVKLQDGIFTVIGVLADNSQMNNRSIAPITTVMSKILWTHYYSSIDIAVQNVEEIDTMKSVVDQELITYFNTTVDEKPFTVSSLSEILDSIQSVTQTLTMFLAWIAAISLIVGWIWVMNIMLVSVTERTREIGIRKALWARRIDILYQFLTEALFISIIAWLIWIWLSYVVVWGINKLTTAVITSSSIIIAFSSVVFIGIFFGILPASKASKLKPIDALRYE